MTIFKSGEYSRQSHFAPKLQVDYAMGTARVDGTAQNYHCTDTSSSARRIIMYRNINSDDTDSMISQAT